jgi:hypothetical protein
MADSHHQAMVVFRHALMVEFLGPNGVFSTIDSAAEFGHPNGIRLFFPGKAFSLKSETNP